jgi:hypothetical protein
MCRRVEKLGAEIDGDALPLVVDGVRVGVASDFRASLEKIDVARALQKVRRRDASRAAPDDRDARLSAEKLSVRVRARRSCGRAATERSGRAEPGESSHAFQRVAARCFVDGKRR